MRDGGDDGDGRFPAIEDLAILGDGRTAALVSRDGTVEWMCLPRFDGPSVFGSLLDRRVGGSFGVHPVGEFSSERRYVGPTPVLETTFRTPDGVARLTDVMPVVSREERDRRPWPEHQLIRRLSCAEGQVELEVLCDPRPDYGRAAPPAEKHGGLGWWWQHGAHLFALLGDGELSLAEDGHAVRGTILLRAGETRWLSFSHAGGEPAIFLDPGDEGPGLVDSTLAWWEDWAGRCRYDGPWREMVVRSAVTLKLLAYAPSGAVVAAATTSLPEVLGGSRNWDYRYCWLRDASWTLRALFELGYREEAEAFFDWILYATRLTAPRIGTLYDLHGDSRREEETLDHLSGYRSSRPVRVGNDAVGQLQLDVYGEVVVAAFEWVDQGGDLDAAEMDFLLGLGKEICEVWEEPDEGIWEVRAGPRHHTYSKVMCWAALDRLLKLHARGDLDRHDVPADLFRRHRDAIRDAVETRGWDAERGCYRAVFDDGEGADGALLRLPAAGYVRADDERFWRTCEHLEEVLAAGDGLMYRYSEAFDRLPGREGAFNLVGFWMVECLALAGELDRARELFDRLTRSCNDLGLYSEETDPASGTFLGNFPQAFTHIGLVNAALTLDACVRGDDALVRTPWEHQDAPGGNEARHGGGRPYDPAGADRAPSSPAGTAGRRHTPPGAPDEERG